MRQWPVVSGQLPVKPCAVQTACELNPYRLGWEGRRWGTIPSAGQQLIADYMPA